MAMTAEQRANSKIIIDSLMGKPDPLPLVSAAAIAGNGWQENLLRPITVGPKDHGSDGLLQWRLSRLVELQQRPGWDTLQVQCQFFKDECKRDYPKLWAMLKNPGQRTLANLTLNICDIYERPSVAGRKPEKRIEYAEQIYNLYKPKFELPPSLDPVVNSPGSSLLGVLSLVVAWLVEQGISLPINTETLILGVIGVVLIFFVGRKDDPVAEEVHEVDEPLKESSMNVATIVKLAQAMEALLPVIQKVVEDIPKIKADINELKASLQSNDDSNVAAGIDNLIAQLKNLGGN